jgi:hypothetical protein
MAKLTGHVPKDAKWTRLVVDVPPAIADELMRLHRRDMGVNASAATRQGMLRSAILTWWEERDPEPDAPITATAVEIIDARALPPGAWGASWPPWRQPPRWPVPWPGHARLGRRRRLRARNAGAAAVITSRGASTARLPWSLYRSRAHETSDAPAVGPGRREQRRERLEAHP